MEEEETSFVVVDGVVVPESALLQRERGSRYGSVPELPDEELADPEELERQIYIREFGPVLALPIKTVRREIRPAIDETGCVDWGAFATVDFERHSPALDKARHKADRLREELKDVLIQLGIATRHVPAPTRKLVLKQLRDGVIEFDDIVDADMQILARLFLRSRRLQAEIAAAEEASRQRKQKEFAKLFG